MADEAQEVPEALDTLAKMRGKRYITRRQVLKFRGDRKALAGAKHLSQLLNDPKYGPMLRNAHNWWGWRVLSLPS